MSILSHFSHILEEIWIRKIPFFATFFWVAFLTYGFLYVIDFVPEVKTTDSSIEERAETEGLAVVETTPEEVVQELPDPVPETFTPTDATPDVIFIDKLDKEITVLNPQTRTIAGLDEALLSGVVRHPDSANLLQDGTMFLFGHSSYLPNVLNKNFQAFNGIQNLTWGDKIRVHSNDTEYIYRVDKVYKAAASEASVEIKEGEPGLTLATCNSFGSKDDRFIVESTLVETKQI